MIHHTDALAARYAGLTALVLLLLILIPSASVLAQETVGATDGASSGGPAGIDILILMMGMAALAVVGLYYAGQNRGGVKADGDQDE
jgi:hypothetical protein